MRNALIVVLPLSLILFACTREVVVGIDPLRHVVLVDLKNSNDAGEFSADCFQLLNFPAAVNVIAGPKLELNSSGEIADFNVAAEVGLQSAAACVKFVEHPAYTALMAKWRPRANSICTATFGPRCETAVEAAGDSSTSAPKR
ncbi:MAG: hypothetical protein ACREJO_16720 [Phycisphaerales bacterium]